MNQKVFFAIQINPQIRAQLASFRYKWLKLPIRWVTSVNLHITLLFIGQAKIEDIGRLSETIHDIARVHNSFILEFNKIKLQPDADRPNLLWVEGEKNKDFSRLNRDIEDVLKAERLYFSSTPRSKEQIPHITLGRVRKWQWQQIDPEERPDINEPLSLKIPVNEITLVESKMRRQGPEYFILETASLKKSL